MANRKRAGIIGGALVLVPAAIAGCSGGTNRTDNSVQVAITTRAIDGVWRKSSIATRTRWVSCSDPNQTIIGSPISELTENGVVVDTCSPYESIIVGATDSKGNGRYRLVGQRSTEDGAYHFDGTTLTLTRDTIDSVPFKNKVPAQPNQRLVFRVTFNDADQSFTITPVPQTVALKKVDATQPAFRADGTLVVENVTPVLNADKSISVIILPELSDFATVNSDLSVSVGPTASPAGVVDPPGFPKQHSVSFTFTYQPDTPGQTRPTPGPAPL